MNILKKSFQNLLIILHVIYSQYPKLVKKTIKYGFFDSINGNSVDEKLNQILEKKIKLSFNHLV